MSFSCYKKCVEYGDTVIVFLGHNLRYTFNVEKDKVFQTKYGALKHNDLVGVTFGTKVICSKGWVYILYPTPELWTVTLPHRTQILYSTDISMVILQLDLKPGSVICEAGTGSGSLSHAIARTIFPYGYLYTFDFHALRVETAKQEFEDHGLSNIVTIEYRDVCQNGFGLENIVDAVFLDLPTPWQVVPSAKAALKLKGGRLCSFSPCIEQVQRTCEALETHGFCDITTVECLTRIFDVRTINIPFPNLGCDLNNKDNELINQNSDLETEDINSTNSSSQHINKLKNSNKKEYSFKSGVPPMEMPGHTGYLTFCTLYPKTDVAAPQHSGDLNQ